MIGKFLLCALFFLFLNLHKGGLQPSYALDVVREASMTNNQEALDGLRELVRLLRSAGLRTADLESALVDLQIHEEGAQAGGVILGPQDAGIIFLPKSTRYNGFSIFVSNIHIVLKGTAIRDLENRQFGVTNRDLNSSARAAVHELLHATIHDNCFKGSVDDEEALVHALEGHIAARVRVDLLFRTGLNTDARSELGGLNDSVPTLLDTEPAWEKCFANLGHLFVTVDFDTFPNSSLVLEGDKIVNQYLQSGVIFSVADSIFLPSPDTGIYADDASQVIAFYPGMTPPNIIQTNGYFPGAGVGFTCNSDPGIDFSSPVSSVSIRIFLDSRSLPESVRLVAKDGKGKVIAQDEVDLTTTSEPTTLSVFDRKTRIASVATEGLTGSNGCAAYDNLAFFPFSLLPVPVVAQVETQADDTSLHKNRPKRSGSLLESLR